jgi:hypothetical protein
MATETNPHYFATATKDDTSIDQITDSTDFPHTGLIKALSLGMRGNYVVKGSATDFDITQASSGNVLQVAEGKIFRDGAFLSVSADNFTASDFQATANTHHLLVADNATPPVLKIRKHGSSTQNAIPPYDDGDTIIAIITYTSNGFNDMVVQYLTTSKVANNVSIGYGTSAYTEAMSIEGSATKTTFHNKIADADVRFVLGDNTADEKFEIVTDDDADGDLTDTLTEVFSVDGTGLTKVKSLSLGSAAELTITESSDDITIKNTVSDKDIIFNINDGGSDTEIMRLDGSTSNVGIGTNAPDKNLHIRAATSPTLRIQENSQDGYLDLVGLQDSQAQILAKNTSTNEATMLDIDVDADGSGSQSVRFFRNSGTTGSSFVYFLKGDATNTTMALLKSTTGQMSFGTNTIDTNAMITVEGAISLDEISAPTNTADRGQLYTNADNHLHFINGAGTDVKVTEEVFIVALSDETTDLTTGTAKASFNMPFAMTLTGVKANCTTAPVGSTIIVDINEAGSTILSTKLSIDASETTSTSAASAAVISDTALANDALITFDIDQIGSSTAGKGLKVTLYGYRA